MLLLLAMGLAQSSPAKAEPEPRLMGIVIAGALRQAIFADPAGQGTQIVREGEQIGASRVYLITPREVGLEDAAGRHLVQPGSNSVTRSQSAPPLALVNPYHREAEFENDQ